MMPADVGVEEYVHFLGDEYLDAFIPAGGSAVKVAIVPDDRAGAELWSGALSLGRSKGFAAVGIDAAATRVNLIQQIFFAVASEIDWSGYCRTIVGRLVEESFGPECHGLVTMQQVAQAKPDIDAVLIRNRMSEALTKWVVRNYALAKDFRLAMVHLCLGEFLPQAYTEHGCTTILEWLRGELKLISALKERQIFQKITRHNARSMLGSTARWLHQAGTPGLLLVLDIRQFVVPRRAGVVDAAQYYTPAALMDAYEVLRQFIDATDEVEHLMLLVIAPSELLEEGKRGFHSYPALRNRIWDDVRDRDRVNPCAPMVRLAGMEG